MGKGTLQQRIMRTIAICVLLPLGILALIASLQLSPLTAMIGSQGTSSIETEGINALRNSSVDAGKYVKNELDQAKVDLQRLVRNAVAILNGSMNVTETRASYRQGGTAPPGNYTDYTDFGFAGSLTASMNDTINKTAYMDYACKGICMNNVNYNSIVQVYQNTVSRMYPYIVGSRVYTVNLTQSDWYMAAKVAGRNNIVLSRDSTIESHGAVYISMPIMNENSNTTVIGCIAIEYKLANLRAHLNGTRIQKTGYVALIDHSWNALSHRNSTATVAAVSILTLEGTSSTEFQNLLTTAVSGATGSGAFMKAAAEWRVAYSPVGTGGLYMLAFVPITEIIAPGVQLQGNLAALNTVAIIVFICAAAAIFVVVYFLVIKVSHSITRPVTTLTNAIENMTKGDLTKEIPMDAKSRGDELGTLAKSFQNLLITMRLGNKSYYRGDMSVAYTNYQAALELFLTTKNLRGQGMCYNNLGNIYRNWADYEHAKESYDKAIQIGEQQTDHAGLAARYNNRGLLSLSKEDWDGAKNDFDRALQIDKELGDDRGVAMRTRNLGIMNMLKQQWKPAQKLLDEAMKIDSDIGNDAGMAEDEFQLGRLAQATNDLETAEGHYKKALKTAESLQNFPLMKHILDQMVKLYDALDSTALLHKAEADLAKINEVLVKAKEVVFVMDQSGSMQAEGKMTAARSGALEVFEETINIGDDVAVVGFHSILNPLLPLTTKKGTAIANIKNVFVNLDSTPYQTMFYDAVAHAIEMLRNTPADHQRWIVALTDGQDNMSKLQNPRSLAELIKTVQPPLNFILIGVGSELKMVHNEMTMIVEATPKGKYIKIYSPKNVKKAIEEAFQTVKEIMASAEIEGFSPE